VATAEVTSRTVALQNFSLGSVQSVARNLIPPGGAYSITNGLLTEEGAITKRGGSAYYSSSNGPDSSVLSVWANDEFFATFGWSTAHTFRLGGGLAPVTVSTSAPGAGARASMIGRMCFIDGGYLYAGSSKGPPTRPGRSRRRTGARRHRVGHVVDRER
jgi:hypothetical protein